MFNEFSIENQYDRGKIEHDTNLNNIVVFSLAIRN